MFTRIFSAFAAMTLAFLATVAVAQQNLKPGDKGFGHTPELHKAYQKVFNGGICHCAAGECRPTVAQSVKPDPANPTGLQVKINGEWCSVSGAVLKKINQLKGLTPEEMDELNSHPAHVCAYTKGPGDKRPCGERIECVLMPGNS